MMSLGFFWLGVMAAPDSVPPVPAPAVADDPAIRLWMNNSRQFREGEEARVQVETDRDGYLVVFHYDPEGHLRVLFPLSPRDDNFVHGGHKYEVRGRGDREASFIAGGEGEGLVYAAVSDDPIHLDDMAAGNNWDYGRLSLRNSRDPEAEITDLMQQAVSDRGFDYDVLSYRVYGYRDDSNYRTSYGRPYGYYDDYYCDYWYRPSLFGCRYYPNGVSVGLYGYYPFGYGYGYGYGGFGGFYSPFYRNRFYNRNYPIVIGRPRGYTIGRRPFNSGGFGRRGGFGGALPSGRSGEVRGGGHARPSGDGWRGRPSGGGSVSRPRGRRSHDDLQNPTPFRPGVVQEGRARRVEVGDGERRGDFGRGDARPNIEYRSRSERGVEMPPARRSGGDGGPRIERSRGGEGPRAEPARTYDRPRSSAPPPAGRAGAVGATIRAVSGWWRWRKPRRAATRPTLTLAIRRARTSGAGRVSGPVLLGARPVSVSVIQAPLEDLGPAEPAAHRDGGRRVVVEPAIENEMGDDGPPDPVAAGTMEQGWSRRVVADQGEQALERFVRDRAGRHRNVDVSHAQRTNQLAFVERARLHRIANVEHELDARVPERLEMGAPGLTSREQVRERLRGVGDAGESIERG